MVITFDEDGTVQFTRNPEALALFPDQQLSIHRMSDILFEESTQRYYILWLRGPAKGHSSKKRYGTYEEAVQAEIATADALRAQGHIF